MGSSIALAVVAVVAEEEADMVALLSLGEAEDGREVVDDDTGFLADELDERIVVLKPTTAQPEGRLIYDGRTILSGQGSKLLARALDR